MNIPWNCRTNRLGGCHNPSPVRWVHAHLPQIIESFWFCLTFFLFLLMGPFSAIVVLIGLGSLASEKNREQMTEPAHL